MMDGITGCLWQDDREIKHGGIKHQTRRKEIAVHAMTMGGVCLELRQIIIVGMLSISWILLRGHRRYEVSFRRRGEALSQRRLCRHRGWSSAHPVEELIQHRGKKTKHWEKKLLLGYVMLN